MEQDSDVESDDEDEGGKTRKSRPESDAFSDLPPQPPPVPKVVGQKLPPLPPNPEQVIIRKDYDPKGCGRMFCCCDYLYLLQM
jgi:hypothetical protein